VTFVERVQSHGRDQVDTRCEFPFRAGEVAGGLPVPAHAGRLQRDDHGGPGPGKVEFAIATNDLDLVGLGDVRVDPIDGRHEVGVPAWLARIREEGEQAGPSFREGEEPGKGPRAAFERVYPP
jgi:hypothetical protein